MNQPLGWGLPQRLFGWIAVASNGEPLLSTAAFECRVPNLSPSIAGGFLLGYALSKALGMPERAARTNSIEVRSSGGLGTALLS